MANRRMLSKTISTSRKVNLVSDFAKLLFTWIIPHTDDFGRIDGNPEIVKALVMPLNKSGVDEIEAALVEIAQAGLIDWYITEGQSVIQVIQFEEFQSNLHKRTESRFLDKNEYSIDLLANPRISQNLRPKGTELKGTELKGREQNRATARCVGFENFWLAYPKKRSKGQAKRAWERLKPTEQLRERILAALEQAKTSAEWAKDHGRYIPYPATWLNAEGWEDQHETAVKPTKSAIDEWLDEAANG